MALHQRHKIRRDTLKLMYRSTKTNIGVSGWLYKTKIHVTQLGYQENNHNIPPYFMAFALTVSRQEELDKGFHFIQIN